MNIPTNETSTRREFLKSSSVGALATAIAFPHIASAAPNTETLRVGLIGCGGRGTGAVQDVLGSAENVTLVAMGDVFRDRLDESLKRVKEGKFGAQIHVTPERAFVGFDAFEKVIASDVNYIILASPPGFRPAHLKAAIDAGKHVFTEKPIAVDPAGVREVLALVEVAKQKKLGIGTGTQRHHQAGYIETIKRIQDGRSFVNLPLGGLVTNSRGAAKNVAQHLLLALDSKTAWGEIFNCGDEVQYSLAQWVELIAGAMGAKLAQVDVPNALRWTVANLSATSSGVPAMMKWPSSSSS